MIVDTMTTAFAESVTTIHGLIQDREDQQARVAHAQHILRMIDRDLIKALADAGQYEVLTVRPSRLKALR